MEIEKILGRIIANHRLELGLSQDELSHKSKVDRSYVGRVERGERKPTINILLKLSEGLNIPLSKIIEELEHKLSDIYGE